jgi:hypothetical protein
MNPEIWNKHAGTQRETLCFSCLLETVTQETAQAQLLDGRGAVPVCSFCKLIRQNIDDEKIDEFRRDLESCLALLGSREKQLLNERAELDRRHELNKFQILQINERLASLEKRERSQERFRTERLLSRLNLNQLKQINSFFRIKFPETKATKKYLSRYLAAERTSQEILRHIQSILPFRVFNEVLCENCGNYSSFDNSLYSINSDCQACKKGQIRSCFSELNLFFGAQEVLRKLASGYYLTDL